MKTFAMFLALLYSLVQAQFAIAQTPVWLPPFFLELPVNTALRVKNSEDSILVVGAVSGHSRYWLDLELRGSSLAQSEQEKRFDQASSYGQPVSCQRLSQPRWLVARCVVADVTGGMRLSIRVRNSRFAEQEFAKVLQSVRRVGEIGRIQVLAVFPEKKQAIVKDESGLRRNVSVGDLVSTRFGRITEVDLGGLSLEYFDLTDDGVFESRRTKIPLTR